MTRDEAENAMFSAFLMGVRVTMQAHEMHVSAGDEHKHWNLIEAISKGEAQLEYSGQAAAKHPQMTGSSPISTEKVHVKDKITAAAILRGMR